jgi:hypothetical protein
MFLSKFFLHYFDLLIRSILYCSELSEESLQVVWQRIELETCTLRQASGQTTQICLVRGIYLIMDDHLLAHKLAE